MKNNNANASKLAANNSLKIEIKSLRTCLNVVKQAADDDANGVRAYIEEIGLTVGLLKRTMPVDIIEYTQKSRTGSFCPWYVLGALKKAAKGGALETAIKTREAAEKEAKKAAKEAKENK